jgi:hypothetical protein
MQEVGIKFRILSEGQQLLAAIKAAVTGTTSEVRQADTALKGMDAATVAVTQSVAKMSKELATAKSELKGVASEAAKAAHAAADHERALKKAAAAAAEEARYVKAAAAEAAASAASHAGLNSTLDELRARFAALKQPAQAVGTEVHAVTEASGHASLGFLDIAASTLGVNSTMLVAGAAIGTVATVLVSAAQAGYALVDSQSALAEVTANLAVRTGLTVGQVERLQAMGRIAGVGIEVLESSAVLLGSALEDSGAKGDKLRKTLQGLGIDSSTASGGEREYGAVLLEVLGKLAQVEDSTKRVALAKELLGRNAAKQLAPLIADYGELNRAVRALGVGFDDNVVKVLAKANDEIDKAGIAWDEFKKQLAAKIAPIYIPIIRVVTDTLTSKSNQEQAVPDSIALARASEASRLLDPAAVGVGDSRLDPLLDARSKSQFLIGQDFAAGKARAEAYRSRRSNTEDGLKDRLRDVDAERDKVRRELLSGLGGTLSSGSAGLLEGQISTLDKEAASIQSRLDSIKKTAKDYEHQVAEIKKLERELASLQSEAELKPFGAIGQIEQRRRNKVDEIKRELPAGAKRDSLLADFNRAFGEELAAEARKISDQQQQILDAFEKVAFRGRKPVNLLGDGSGLRDEKRQFQADDKIRDIESAIKRADIVDQSSRTAKLAELQLGPGREIEAARAAIGIRKQLVQELFDFEVAQAARIEDAEDRRVALVKAEQTLRKETRDAELDGAIKLLELQKQRSEQYREDAGRVFDALTAKGGGGLREMLGGVVKQQERAIFQNISQGIFQRAGGALGKLGEASGLGGLLKGTLFDPQNAATPEIRSRDKNTKAVENLTTAMTGGGLLGQLSGAGTTAGDLLGNLGSGGTTPPFASGNGGGIGGFLGRILGGGGSSAGSNKTLGSFFGGLGSTLSGGLFRGLSGGDYSIQGPDGRTTTASSLGLTSTAGRVGNVVGSAALVGAGAYGIYSGIKQGGAAGTLSAIQGGLSIASAIPGPQQPFIQAAALVAGLFKGLLPDPRQQRENEIREELQKRKYTAPTAIDRVEDRDGNALDYDMNGNLRKAGGSTVTVVVNALDTKSFLDRSAEVASAVTKALREGNDGLRVGIQKSVFGVA